MNRREIITGALSAAAFLEAMIGSEAEAAPSVARPGGAATWTWDLSPLYAGVDAWEADRARIPALSQRVAGFKGSLCRDASRLADGLDAVSDLRRCAGKLAAYSYLSWVEDQRVESAGQRRDVGARIATEAESAVAFVYPEIAAMNAGVAETWIAEHARLGRHRPLIEEAFARSDHIPSADLLGAIQAMDRWRQQAPDTYAAVFASSLSWRNISDHAGQGVIVDRAAYGRLRTSPNGGDRVRGAEAYYGELARHADLFALLLNRRLEAQAAVARLQNSRDGAQAFLSSEGMPDTVREQLFSQARAGVPVLRRYMTARARCVGLDRHSQYHSHAPSPASSRRFTVEESMRIAVSAAGPFGSEIQGRLERRLREPWSHLLPSPGKDSGIGGHYPVAGTPPYWHMNHDGTVASSSTLAGLAFSMTWSADIPAEFAPDTSRDPTIWVNGLIYLGNMLHDTVVEAEARDSGEQIVMLIRQLDLLSRHFFSHALIAELERDVEAAALRGLPPSGAETSKLYLEKLHAYYGEEAVPPVFAAEWIHQRVSFYGHDTIGWPIALAGAVHTAERVRARDPSVAAALDGTARGRRFDTSYSLFRDAGADLATAAPYQSLFRRMSSLTSNLERLLDSGHARS